MQFPFWDHSISTNVLNVKISGVLCLKGKSPNVHVVQVIKSQRVSLIFVSESSATNSGSPIYISHLFVVATCLDGCSKSDQPPGR